VALSWSAVSGASDYEVWRNPGANCTGATQVVSTTGGATTYTNTGLTGNAQYSYYIKAKNACGTSANGACSTTTTVCLPNIVYLSHGVPAQITGDGDGNAEPGEKYSVVVTLRNTGDAGATAVTAQLAGNGITVCNNPGLYGAMAVGGTAVYTFEFVIDDDFEASFGCGTDIGFDIVTKTCTELTPAGANESDAFSATVGENLGGGTPVDLAIQPSIADTYIQQDSSSTNYGTASTLYVTSLRQQGTQRNRRALLNFDLSSIPAGSTINTAQLELYCTAAASDTRTLNVHYLSTAWTETGATWTNMSANYNATVQSSIAAGITTGWKIWTGLATLVQNWHDGAVANHGLMLQDNTENNQGERTYQFASNDYTTNPAYQPILRINYTPPGGGWDCSDVAAGTCAAAAPPEVSGIPDHRLKAAKNTDPALVDLRFEEVGASHYQVYVSKTAATAPFLVTNPAEGDALCSLSGWTGPDAEGMLTLTGVDLDAGLTGEAPALFFLVTGDNGFAAEGPLGFATGPVVRTADSYCNR